MTYAVILLLAFCIVVMLRNFRNRFALSLTLMALSISLIVFSQLFFLSKHGNYPGGSGFFSLDYKIFVLLYRIRMPYRRIFRINNAGIALYAATICIFSAIYLYGRTGMPKSVRPRVVLYTVFPILYLILYEPETCYRLYMWYYHADKVFVRTVICTVDLCMQLLLLFCIFAPLISMFWHGLRAYSDFIRERTFAISFCLFCVDLLFLLTYYGPINRIYFLLTPKELPAALIKQSYNLRYYFTYQRLIPISMCIVVVSMFIILAREKVIRTADMYRGRQTSGGRRTQRLNQRLREIMHSYKNTFFVQQILLKQLTEQYGTEEGKATLTRLTEVTDQKMQDVTHTLDMLHSPHRQNGLCNVCTCMEKAISSLPPHDGIKISFSRAGTGFMTFFEERYLTEVFLNLLQNALDAVSASNRKDRAVRADVTQEPEIIIVRIADNGIGITAKQKRHIFSPYYSTKPADKGWGLGLSYAANMVHLQHGLIRVKSKPGEETVFEIVLGNAEVKGSWKGILNRGTD